MLERDRGNVEAGEWVEVERLTRCSEACNGGTQRSGDAAYNRQIILRGFDFDGQEALKVLVC